MQLEDALPMPLTYCAEAKAAFYRKGGFVPRPATRPGMQYTGGRDL